MSIETAKMSERGQIIIPKEIRDAINAKENTLFAVSALSSDTIVLKKIDREKLLAEFREIRARTKKLSSEQIEAEIHAYRAEKRKKESGT